MFCIIAQQALPPRGNWNSELGVEETSNLHQLLLLRAGDWDIQKLVNPENKIHFS